MPIRRRAPLLNEPFRLAAACSRDAPSHRYIPAARTVNLPGLSGSIFEILVLVGHVWAALGTAEFAYIVGLSLTVSLSATAVAAVVGLPCGAALAICRFPGRRFLILLANAFLGLPPVVVGLTLPRAPAGTRGTRHTRVGSRNFGVEAEPPLFIRPSTPTSSGATAEVGASRAARAAKAERRLQVPTEPIPDAIVNGGCRA